jgi:NADH-quinone oxidoreductase subunit G
VDYAPGARDAAGFKPENLGAPGPVSQDTLRSPITDFYLTNPIARASETMAACSKARRGAGSEKVAAE